jgi:ADP-ribosylation factor GTPase-activating protein 1
MSAAPHIRKMFAELQARPENKVCADCSSRVPQWASTSYGTYICLECSGIHRSLGVHLSFVQSVTMDSWKNERFVAKMNGGGNDQVSLLPCLVSVPPYGRRRRAAVLTATPPAVDE